MELETNLNLLTKNHGTLDPFKGRVYYKHNDMTPAMGNIVKRFLDFYVIILSANDLLPLAEVWGRQ